VSFFLLFCKTINEFIYLKFSRIPMYRVPSQFSSTANCTQITDNVTTCDGISRTFGRISVIKSSADENLVNYLDVSDSSI
jgi:hypothetical protein